MHSAVDAQKLAYNSMGTKRHAEGRGLAYGGHNEHHCRQANTTPSRRKMSEGDNRFSNGLCAGSQGSALPHREHASKQIRTPMSLDLTGQAVHAKQGYGAGNDTRSRTENM
jgi:hypothetical protein